MCLSATLLHQWSLLSPVSSTFPSLMPCPAHVSMLKHTHVLLGGKFLPFILSSPSPTTLSFFFLSWLLFICFVVVCGYLVGVYIYGLHEMFWYRPARCNNHIMENEISIPSSTYPLSYKESNYTLYFILFYFFEQSFALQPERQSNRTRLCSKKIKNKVNPLAFMITFPDFSPCLSDHTFASPNYPTYPFSASSLGSILSSLLFLLHIIHHNVDKA